MANQPSVLKISAQLAATQSLPIVTGILSGRFRFATSALP
jgi:hypothetical protein